MINLPTGSLKYD